MVFGLLETSWVDKPAPEFEKITSWLNSPPLKMEQLKGKVVLIDFWTYSCINCIRTLPFIKEFWNRYKDKGLVIIGVHTPEFDFEKYLKNIQQALEKHGIEYPIAIDSDYGTWKAWKNAYWPRHFIVDAKGIVRYDHVGEGGEEEMEDMIVKLLNETSHKVQKRTDARQEEYAEPNITPEIHAGSERYEGIGSSGACVPGGECIFKDNKVAGEHERDLIYLEGAWDQQKEYLRHMRDKRGYIILNYKAKVANAVLNNFHKTRIKCEVLLDDQPLTEENAGKDIHFEGDKSIVIIDRADLYNLVRASKVEEHELKIVVNSPDFAIYAYTFG